MDQNNKQATSEKNSQAEKAPQQDLKTSPQDPQNKDASQKRYEKDAEKAPANPAFGEKPASDQAKHL